MITELQAAYATWKATREARRKARIALREFRRGRRKYRGTGQWVRRVTGFE